MKVFVKDARLRRHSVDVDDGASVAHLKLLVANNVTCRWCPPASSRTSCTKRAFLRTGTVSVALDTALTSAFLSSASEQLQRLLHLTASLTLRGLLMRTRPQPLKQPMRLPQQMQVSRSPYQHPRKF
jgi:hypothetical protein